MSAFLVSTSTVIGQMTLEDLSRGFRERSNVLPVAMAFLLIGVTLVMAVLLLLAVRREKRGKLYSRPKIFTELCVAHKIDRRGRRLLKELAELAEAEGPELLFVRRDLLARAAFRWRQTHAGASDEPIRNLRQKLFGQDAETASP